MEISDFEGLANQLSTQSMEAFFHAIQFSPMEKIGPGKIIQYPGDDQEWVNLIHKGGIRMFVCSDTDQFKTLATIGPGFFLGLQDLFHTMTSVGGETLEESSLIRFPKKSLLDLSRGNSEIMEWLARSMSYMILDGIGEMRIQRGENRVLQYFKWLFREKGVLENTGRVILPHPRSVTEIAGLLMMSREAVSRIISGLGKTGLLTLQEKSVTVPDMGKFLDRVQDIPVGLGYLGAEG